MATTRMLRTPKPLSCAFTSSSSSVQTVRCLSNAVLTSEKKKAFGDGERKSRVAVKASVAAPESVILSKPELDHPGKDLASLIPNVSGALLKVLTPVVKSLPWTWKSNVQIFIEKVIINCRFFTAFAVAGSLLGSVLCFLEGCSRIVESYFQYFHSFSHKVDQEHVIFLLIEAIDMFLVGTGMFLFGVGLYAMFVGSKNMQPGDPIRLPKSNLFGLFHLKTLPTWVELKSVSQAKSKIGYAVTMILQVGVLEKFKSVPLVTSLDLACFAGAVLVSSASIFLLSRLSTGSTTMWSVQDQ